MIYEKSRSRTHVVPSCVAGTLTRTINRAYPLRQTKTPVRFVLVVQYTRTRPAQAEKSLGLFAFMAPQKPSLPIVNAGFFAAIDDELRDSSRVHKHGQEEDLREALSRVMTRVQELVRPLLSLSQLTSNSAVVRASQGFVSSKV